MKRKVLTLSILFVLFVSLSGCSKGIPQADYDALVLEKEGVQEELSKIKADYEASQKEYSALKTEYDSLNASIEELNKKYEPYVKLSKAEAEAATAEKELKAEEDKKALEELKAKEAKEKAEKEAEEKKKAEKEEKAGYNTGITYSNLARTPDDYKGKKVKFKGEVVQVIEGGEETQIRFAVNGDYDKMLYCAFTPDTVSFRILEDDVITIYGLSLGLTSYQSTLGGTITIPAIWVDKMDQ